MKSAITICLVSEAHAGPFVFHEGLEKGCAQAAKLGFDAVEIFPPDAQTVDVDLLKKLLRKHRLKVAAFGTGAGWLRKQWSLTSTDAGIRENAATFIQSIIELGAQFRAPAIIGSMQGRVDAGGDRTLALAWLAEGLATLSHVARSYRLPLLYEPLNRYETNLFNRLADTATWLREQSLENVKILADLFHMNIEEADLSKAIRQAGAAIGHVHFADSNRRAIGFGHTRIKPVIAALRAIGYEGYLSAEIFPLPDAATAAQQTIDSFQKVTDE